MYETVVNVISNIFSGIRIRDILDIAIVAFATYKILGFIKETRAEQLIKGLLLLACAALVSIFLDLYTVKYILVNGMKLGFIALVIIFQPELRRGLEYLGRSRVFGKQFMRSEEKEDTKSAISIITKAVDDFSATKTGALIIMERDVALTNIAETGILIDSQITKELLGSIFYNGTPLHDGAVLIRHNRVYAAGCLLPLSSNRSIGSELGTRHRAGIGISEMSDAISIIVSEETGIISVAMDGKLSRFLDSKSLEKILLTEYLFDSGDEGKGGAVGGGNVPTTFNLLNNIRRTGRG